MKYFTVMFALGLAACGGHKTPYDHLCKIYGEYEIDPHNSVQASEIIQRVRRELPEIYPAYEVVVLNGIDRRYDMLQEQARQYQKQQDWQCDALRKSWPPGVRQITEAPAGEAP